MLSQSPLPKSELVIVGVTPTILTSAPLPFTITVKSAVGATLSVGVDYLPTYTNGTITWITPPVGSEVLVSYTYDYAIAHIQDALDWIALYLATTLATIEVASANGVIALPSDAIGVSDVHYCGCVPVSCRCGSCFDWQFVAPSTVEVWADGEYTICYIKRVSAVPVQLIPPDWWPAINWWMAWQVGLFTAASSASSTAGVLRSEEYGFGDESVKLQYSEAQSGSVSPYDAMIAYLNRLKSGRQMGARAKSPTLGGLECP